MEALRIRRVVWEAAATPERGAWGAAAPQGAGGGGAARNKGVGLGRSSRTSAEDLINAKAAIKHASVLYSCLMHAIITRYMHTNSTLGVSAGCPHTSVSRMTFGAGNWKLILRKPDDRAPASDCIDTGRSTISKYKIGVQRQGGQPAARCPRLDTGRRTCNTLAGETAARCPHLRKPDDVWCWKLETDTS